MYKLLIASITAILLCASCKQNTTTIQTATETSMDPAQEKFFNACMDDIKSDKLKYDEDKDILETIKMVTSKANPICSCYAEHANKKTNETTKNMDDKQKVDSKIMFRCLSDNLSENEMIKFLAQSTVFACNKQSKNPATCTCIGQALKEKTIVKTMKNGLLAKAKGDKKTEKEQSEILQALMQDKMLKCMGK